MKDVEIKRRLSEVGLPTQGDRRALIRRHQEFTLLYNTQCDALEPKSSETLFLMLLIRLSTPSPPLTHTPSYTYVNAYVLFKFNVKFCYYIST